MNYRPTSREYRIYLALWRKALRSPEPVTVLASNLSIAIAMRQGMYRAIRDYRGGQRADLELMEASEKFVIRLNREADKDSPHTIVFLRRATLSELDMTMLGLDEDDLLLEEERVLGSLVDKLAEKPEEKTISTPFYSRSE